MKEQRMLCIYMYVTVYVSVCSVHTDSHVAGNSLEALWVTGRI